MPSLKLDSYPENNASELGGYLKERAGTGCLTRRIKYNFLEEVTPH